MNCKICDKETIEKYCELHEKAHKNIIDKYDEWKKALDTSWKEYLNEIMKNPYAGSLVKEVAEQLMRSGV